MLTLAMGAELAAAPSEGPYRRLCSLSDPVALLRSCEELERALFKRRLEFVNATSEHPPFVDEAVPAAIARAKTARENAEGTLDHLAYSLRCAANLAIATKWTLNQGDTCDALDKIEEVEIDVARALSVATQAKHEVGLSQTLDNRVRAAEERLYNATLVAQQDRRSDSHTIPVQEGSVAAPFGSTPPRMGFTNVGAVTPSRIRRSARQNPDDEASAPHAILSGRSRARMGPPDLADEGPHINRRPEIQRRRDLRRRTMHINLKVRRLQRRLVDHIMQQNPAFNGDGLIIPTWRVWHGVLRPGLRFRHIPLAWWL